MLRALKFSGLSLLNLIVAVIGTAVLETALRRAIPSYSIAAVMWKEVVLSIICTALIGFGVWRPWRNSSAKWTWVLPIIWFAFGYLVIVGRSDVFGRLFDLGSGSESGLNVPDTRSFFAFTVPLIRAVSYSAGAYISSLLYTSPVLRT
jgi:uncharacterized membrane protein